MSCKGNQLYPHLPSPLAVTRCSHPSASETKVPPVQRQFSENLTVLLWPSAPHPCQTPMEQEDHRADQGVRHWNRSTVLQARRVMQKFGSCCSSVHWKHRRIKRAQKPAGNVGQNPGLACWFADHGENMWSLWCLQSLLGTAERRKGCHACHSVTPSEESQPTWNSWHVLSVQPRAALLGLPRAENFSSKGAYRNSPPHLVVWTA